MDKLKLIKRFLKRNITGGVLLEAILAIGIIVIVFAGIIGVSLGGLTGTLRGEEKLAATALAQESLEATRSVRDFGWNNLTAGVHGLSDADGYWTLTDAVNTVGSYTRLITITDVDAAAKDVVVHIEWKSLSGMNNFIEMTNRFTNWLNKSWAQSLAADFQTGTRNSTLITNTDGGEITLEKRADFIDTGVYATHDFTGGGDINDIFIDGNVLYVVTTNAGDGKEFASVDISNVSNGIMTDINSLELGTQANKVLVKNGYAYIATNNSAEEVMIVRLSDFNKVNSINMPGSENARSLAIVNNTLYVTKKKSSSRELYAYGIANPEGSIGSVIGSTELGADGNDIVVSGGYAYIATNEDSKELMVVRLSDYALVKSVNLQGDHKATSVIVSGTTAYVGKDREGGGPEFYSLNVASPEGTITINGSVDFGDNENVIDLAISGNTVYAGTERESGAQDKKVAIINTLNNTLTGWVDFQDAENSKSQAIAMQGSYIYVGSTNSTETLQVVRGNESGSYSDTGTFTSAAFDTGSANTTYYSLSWAAAGTGTVKFRIRTADSQANLANAVWVGSDGTNATYYTTSGASIVTAPGASKRWIQYQAEFSGGDSATPIINDVSITYEN
ncbi:hypothetical protein HZA42_02450 [Candidatus Peregrinibacteria bacterium]|nr:hypothetical protein [Candidatus Peregrinibacteria bacterium]